MWSAGSLFSCCFDLPEEPPPDTILMPKKTRSSSSSPSLSSSSSKTPNVPTVCCIINRRSGGRKGEPLFEYLSKFDNCHLFDITELNPPSLSPSSSSSSSSTSETVRFESTLSRLRTVIVNQPNIRVLVGGGDGSIIHAFAIFDRLGLDVPAPPVGIIPLGVGNELSRCIGWGATTSGKPTSLKRYIRSLYSGEVLQLDRWTIHFTTPATQQQQQQPQLQPQLQPSPRQQSSTTTTSDISSGSGSGSSSAQDLVCFFSLGFDAAISHKFHTLRESQPGVCASVGINKFWHAWYGAGEMFFPSEVVSDWIDLVVDGVSIDLPPSIRTLQVLNIHSSADGVDFFGHSQPSATGELQQYVSPALNDGLVEVVGTESVTHLMTTKIKLTHSRRLAQGSHISITLRKTKKPKKRARTTTVSGAITATTTKTLETTEQEVGGSFPIQLDGEPSLLPAGSIVTISFRDRVSVVRGPGSTRGIVPQMVVSSSPPLSNPTTTHSSPLPFSHLVTHEDFPVVDYDGTAIIPNHNYGSSGTTTTTTTITAPNNVKEKMEEVLLETITEE